MEGITEESTSPTHKPSSSSTEPGQKPRKRPPPRPKDIALRQNSHSSEGSNAPKVTFTTSATEEGAHNLEGNSQQKQKQQEFTKKSPHKHDSPSSRNQDHDLPLHKLRESPHRLTTKAQACRIRSEAEDEFFFINYIQMCMCGFWLCVANDGGSVMTFDFTTKPRSQPAGVSHELHPNCDHTFFFRMWTLILIMIRSRNSTHLLLALQIMMVASPSNQFHLPPPPSPPLPPPPPPPPPLCGATMRRLLTHPQVTV